MLVHRCRKGDEEAFRQLVVKYQRKAFAVAYGMVHNGEDAMDIVQEAFIKVYRHIGNFKGSSSFYTWLYRIVMNLSIDFLRKEGKTTQLDYDDKLKHESNVEGDENILPKRIQDNPARALGNKELGDQILKAIDSLSKKHREIIILREVQGLSYEELAKVLKISKGTVMSRLFHARQNLQASLSPYAKA